MKYLLSTLFFAIMVSFSLSAQKVPKVAVPVSQKSKVKAKQQTGIQFEQGSWKDILTLAKETGKPIFVDAYTVWCGPCKTMTKMVFPQADVGDFYNQHYISYKMDMERGEGPTFAKNYKVSAYPTLLYIDTEGKLIDRLVGARPAAELIRMGKTVLKDDERLAELATAYEEGDKSATTLKEYAELLWLSDDAKHQSIVGEYLNGLSKKDKLSKDNVKLIYNYALDIEGTAFKFMEANKAVFVKELGADNITNKMIQTANTAMGKVVASKDPTQLKRILNIIDASEHKDADEMKYRAEIAYFKGVENWKKFSKVAVEYFEKFDVKDPAFLNNVAWEFYQNIDKKSDVEKAASWAKKSTKMMPQHYNFDTYASLLFKLGKKEEALEAAERALELGKRQRRNTKGTMELIKKIKADM
ncbi:MAG: thioredoxin family protein [Chitinophagales bacterium]